MVAQKGSCTFDIDSLFMAYTVREKIYNNDEKEGVVRWIREGG